MFKKLCRWFTGGTDKEKEQDGYDWAKAELQAGTMNFQEILDRCEAPFDGPHPFDRGACRCVYEFQENAR